MTLEPLEQKVTLKFLKDAIRNSGKAPCYLGELKRVEVEKWLRSKYVTTAEHRALMAEAVKLQEKARAGNDERKVLVVKAPTLDQQKKALDQLGFKTPRLEEKSAQEILEWERENLSIEERKKVKTMARVILDQGPCVKLLQTETSNNERNYRKVVENLIDALMQFNAHTFNPWLKTSSLDEIHKLTTDITHAVEAVAGEDFLKNFFETGNLDWSIATRSEHRWLNSEEVFSK